MRTAMKALAIASVVGLSLMTQTGCDSSVAPAPIVIYVDVDSTGDTTTYTPALNRLSYHGVYLGMDSTSLLDIDCSFWGMFVLYDSIWEYQAAVGVDTFSVSGTRNTVKQISFKAGGYTTNWDTIAGTNFNADAILNPFPEIGRDNIIVTDTSVSFTNKHGTPPYKVECVSYYTGLPYSTWIVLSTL